MNMYWVFVRIENGSFIKVTIRADNPYNAKQMLMAQYGDRLMSEPALIPGA